MIVYSLNDLNKIKMDEVNDYNTYISSTINSDNYNILNTFVKDNNSQRYKVNIKTLLNSITTDNFNNVYIKLLNEINLYDNKQELIMNIIDISILNNSYLDNYLIIIEYIISNYDINVSNIIQNYFNLLNNLQFIDTDGDNNYDNYCSNNKNSSKLITYSKIIIHLEKKCIINDYVDILISKLLHQCIVNYNLPDILYNYLLCLYDCLNYHDNTNLLKIKSKLVELKNKTITKKNKFKLLDIIDLFN
jgi:hypothetical protein